MSFANPWDSPEFFQVVVIGGRPVKAVLVEVSGNKIEDDWAVQRPTGSSGATNVFKGTMPPGPFELTFEAVDRASFDDLRELYEALAPKPGSGTNGNGTGVGSPGSAASVGAKYMKASSPASSSVATSPEDLLKQAQAALAAAQSGASSASSATTAASSPVVLLSPGPKPPTLSIVNGFLNWFGITAISRKSWEGPTVTATNSWRVKIAVVTQRAPVKAAVGAASTQPQSNPGQKWMKSKDPASSAKDANKKAAAAGAGT